MSNVFLDRIEAVLTGLPEDAPLHDVYDALSDFAEEDVAAVLATRSLTAGGGGGSLTVAANEGDPVTDVTQLSVLGGDGNNTVVVEDSPGVALVAVSLDQENITWVFEQSGPPDPIDTYDTPAIYDTTAVTGGLYMWNSSQYIKVGNVVA
jgi:hypothetical protein